MKFGIEKCDIVIMKTGKKETSKEIDFLHQEIIKRKIIRTWEYWKRIPSNKKRWKKKN